MTTRNKIIVVLLFLFFGTAITFVVENSDKAKDILAGGFSNMRGFATLTTSDVVTVKVTVSSANFENLATSSFELIPAPGENLAIELVAITGYRNFSSESWNRNRASGLGMGVGFNNANEIVASFSNGFLTGGSLDTTASPNYETKYPFDHVATSSQALKLTRTNSDASVIPTIDGDTSFVFHIL